MEDIEEKILSYPHLSVGEQREVEAHVESNPEWAPLLRDVRSLEGISARVDGELPSDGDRPSDALVATYVAVRHLHPDDVPAELQEVLARLEARLDESAALRRRADAALRRLESAEAAVDPVAHFESLTGHALNETPAAEGATSREKGPAERAADDVSPGLDVALDLSGLLRWGGAVALVLLVGYVGLYGASYASQSTLDRLATVTISNQVVESYPEASTRGASPAVSDTASVDAQYLAALSALRTARTSTLGLFPRYDADRLGRAQRLFRRVLDEVPPRTFLAQEAHFYLGKIALAHKDVAVARSHFKAVVREGGQAEGRRANEAHKILKALQQEYDPAPPADR